MASRRRRSLAWSSSKKIVSLSTTTVPAPAYSQSSPYLELKSIAILSCSNSLTSVSLVVMPYILQSPSERTNPSKVTDQLRVDKRAQAKEVPAKKLL
ncbi:hypothetical protein HDF14_001606 [Edaphobacter lichenicola]|uniref:Uncharacterized protein n=1 Tax=Tunturiibacter gelidiferens TaxID=3069689 RepID=A0A9X0U3J2_9BACT|nr:hypothetical protein [Edaphobacter lichenicola]